MKIEWEAIEQLFQQSANEIKLKKSLKPSKDVIEKLQINEQSVLGKVLVNVAGIIINNYLRVLGKEGELDILLLNDWVKRYYLGNKLIVATDLWGGIFAISNGDFEDDKRNIWYFAPDTLMWENLQINYAEFVTWICSTAIQEFYQGFLWTDFKQMSQEINVNQAVLVYPFLWAHECNIETASKKIVPLKELIAINEETRKNIRKVSIREK